VPPDLAAQLVNIILCGAARELSEILFFSEFRFRQVIILGHGLNASIVP
jgi:hypothetical protein